MGNSASTKKKFAKWEKEESADVCPSLQDANCKHASRIRAALDQLDLISFFAQHQHLQSSINGYADRKSSENSFAQVPDVLAKFDSQSFYDDPTQYRARMLPMEEGKTLLSAMQWFKDYEDIELWFNLHVKHPYLEFRRDDGSKVLLEDNIDMLILRHTPHLHVVYVRVVDIPGADEETILKHVTTNGYAIRLALQAHLLTRVIQEFQQADFTDSFRAVYAQEPRFLTIAGDLKNNVVMYVEYERTLEHYLREVSENMTTCSPEAPRPREHEGLPTLEEAEKLFSK